ncbi:hypothetical protein [Streptomyces sp. 2A115]|uniref:hypothetical protein n=1 Tax=Streptomyces sp. 2A115 TaxID=3457439 RepID=UPI003FD35153
MPSSARAVDGLREGSAQVEVTTDTVPGEADDVRREFDAVVRIAAPARRTTTATAASCSTCCAA